VVLPSIIGCLALSCSTASGYFSQGGRPPFDDYIFRFRTLLNLGINGHRDSIGDYRLLSRPEHCHSKSRAQRALCVDVFAMRSGQTTCLGNLFIELYQLVAVAFGKLALQNGEICQSCKGIPRAMPQQFADQQPCLKISLCPTGWHAQLDDGVTAPGLAELPPSNRRCRM